MKIHGILVSKNAPCWDKFRFISGAKSKDQSRVFMTGIKIERVGKKTVIIATDGRRVHIATMDTLNIEPGYYEVKEKTRDFMILYPGAPDANFPNWRKIVEGLETQKHFKINLGNKTKAGFSQALFSLFTATSAVINFEYLEPLGAVFNPEWDVYFNDSVKAHTFINKDLMAIIMPLKGVDEVVVETSENGPDFQDITPKPALISFKVGKKCHKAA